MKKKDLLLIAGILILAVGLLLYGLHARAPQVKSVPENAQATVQPQQELYSESVRQAVAEYLEQNPAESYLRVTTSENVYSPIPLNEDNAFRLTQPDGSDPFLRTFNNIFVGASVEGGAMLTLSAPEDDVKGASTFISNFAKASLLKRYLWVYLMVVLQRHALLIDISCFLICK